MRILRLKPCFIPLLLSVVLSGCVTHITTDVLQNPPPSERFSSFTQVELLPITLPAPYKGQDANEQALAKIQGNVTQSMTPLLAKWNATGSTAVSKRTLVVTPEITEIKFINATARVWAGAMAGSSAVILKVKITEKESGKIIAEPIFYARAAAMGGAWTFGSTDNIMLTRVANRFTDYMAANYDQAVGGRTGQDPKEQ